MSIGKQRIPMYIGLFLMGLSSVLNYFLVNERGMDGAAFATTFTCFVGMLVGLFYIKRIFGVIMSLKSFGRIIISVLPSSLLGYYFEVSGWCLVPWAVFLLLIYVGMLFLVREINRYDLSIVKSLIAKK